MREVISRHEKWTSIAIVFGLIIGSTTVFAFLSFAYARIQGYTIGDMSAFMGDGSVVAGRNKTRIFLLLNHLFTFIIPSLLAAYILTRKQAIQYLSLTRSPKFLNIALGALLILVAYPFIQKSYEWNAMLPIPGWMLEMETTTNESLRELLTMEGLGEFLISLFVIAVVPGIGEELLFRGIIQKELYRWSQRPWVAVWISAILFSGMHMQFQGFFPRMLLGALLGYLYLLTKNMWIPIIIHFLNNAAPIISMYIFGTDLADLSPEESPDVPFLLAIGSAIAAIAIGLYIKSKNPAPQSIENDGHIEIA